MRCPDCDRELDPELDVEFVEWGKMDNGFGFRSSKHLYLVACYYCGAAVGGGVAAMD